MTSTVEHNFLCLLTICILFWILFIPCTVFYWTAAIIFLPSLNMLKSFRSLQILGTPFQLCPKALCKSGRDCCIPWKIMDRLVVYSGLHIRGWKAGWALGILPCGLGFLVYAQPLWACLVLSNLGQFDCSSWNFMWSILVRVSWYQLALLRYDQVQEFECLQHSTWFLVHMVSGQLCANPERWVTYPILKLEHKLSVFFYGYESVQGSTYSVLMTILLENILFRRYLLYFQQRTTGV